MYFKFWFYTYISSDIIVIFIIVHYFSKYCGIMMTIIVTGRIFTLITFSRNYIITIAITFPIPITSYKEIITIT